MVRRLPRLRLFIPLVHGEVSDPAKLVISRGAGLRVQSMLVGILLRELQPQTADLFVDPLWIIVPGRGCPELRRNYHHQPFATRKVQTPLIAHRIAERVLNLFGQHDEVGIRLQASNVEVVQPAVAEELANLIHQPALLRTTHHACRWNDEAKHGQILLDLQLLPVLGRERR